MNFGFGKLAIGLTMACAVLGSSAVAQDFPSKEIRIVNAFAPGGATDTAIRGLTRNAGEFVDEPIVIESVTGAGGVTGFLKVARANPDGHTLLVADTVLATLPLFQDNLPVSRDDFRPIGIFNLRGAWLLSRPSKGWENLDDFVEAARAEPGALTVGVPSLGSPQQLAVVALESTYDIDVNIVPYGGGAPTMAALLGDQIDAAMPGAPAGLDSVNAGDAVFLVASAEIELPKFEGDVISFGDVGIPYDLGIWAAIWAPKDTPDDVIAQLEEIFGGMATSDDWTEFARGYGVTPMWIAGDEAVAYVEKSASDMAELAKQIK